MTIRNKNVFWNFFLEKFIWEINFSNFFFSRNFYWENPFSKLYFSRIQFLEPKNNSRYSHFSNFIFSRNQFLKLFFLEKFLLRNSHPKILFLANPISWTRKKISRKGLHISRIYFPEIYSSSFYPVTVTVLGSPLLTFTKRDKGYSY